MTACLRAIRRKTNLQGDYNTKIEFYRVKQNSIATIWCRYGNWEISGKLVAKHRHRHDILLTKKAR